MKKNAKAGLVVVISIAVALVLLGGCAAKDEESYTMRIAHILDVGSIRHQYLEQFKAEVEEKTDGNITIQLFPSAQLGSDDELIEQVKNGSIEGYSGSAFDTTVPEYNIYSMPFLFASTEEAAAVMASEWGENLASKSEVNGIKMISTGTAGMRVMTNSKKPIYSPADLRGLKLRTPSWEVTIKTMEALGANTQSIPFNETYMALKNGVADAQENPWVYIVEPKFYEVQEYATDLNWNLTIECFELNLDWYNSLPEEYQVIIKEAAMSAMDFNNEQNRILEKEYIAVCEEAMEITYLTPEQRQAFVDATQSVYDFYIETGLFEQSDIDTIRSTIAEFNAS